MVRIYDGMWSTSSLPIPLQRNDSPWHPLALRAAGEVDVVAAIGAQGEIGAVRGG